MIKFRCSALGKLMTSPRAKGELLSETTKTYLLEIVAQYKYGRTVEITSKYMEKGKEVEEDSLTLYSRLKKNLYKKNVINFTNDFITGTPDMCEGETGEYKFEEIADTKSSWDIVTFLKAKEAANNKDYHWQMQGYQALTGAKIARLAYCLVNAPDYLIDDEKRKLSYRHGLDANALQEGYKRIERNMIFDIDAFSSRYPNYPMANTEWKWDIPKEERMHEITIERNEADIAALYEKITICREYLKTNFGL